MGAVAVAQGVVDRLWYVMSGPGRVQTTIDLAKHAHLLFGSTTKVGANINSQTALQVTAVLQAVRLLALGVATPPLVVQRRDGDRLTDAREESIYRILNRRPNEWQTSFEWRATMMAHAALVGNAYSMITRNGAGEVLELIPIDPRMVVVDQGRDFKLLYTIHLQGGEQLILPAERVFHLRGLSWNAVQGLSVVDLAREAIGLAKASENSQALLDSAGGRPSGILSSKETIGPEQVEKVRAAWNASQTGASRGGVAVLDAGYSFQAMTMSSVDAQHIESREFQLGEIARAFGLFPMMLGATDKTSTFASVEAFFRAHLVYSLQPWHRHWKQLLDKDLLDQEGPLEANFDTSELDRASLKDRGTFFAQTVPLGVYTRNEARKAESLPPLDGLDEPLTPMNMEGSDADPDKPADDSAA